MKIFLLVFAVIFLCNHNGFSKTSRALKHDLFLQTSEDHQPYYYSEARKLLYTDIDLEEGVNGTFFIKDQYCQKIISKDVGPNHQPRGTKTNIEHLWPQSKFNSKLNTQIQKSDLHHLMIVSSKANHLRGSADFSEVDSFYDRQGRCSEATGLGVMAKTPVGIMWSSDDVFQPPKEIRGNIARALFYFSVRYQLSINDTQEYFLKKWNTEDPVDEREIIRNNKIMQKQGNRNPFVDKPELVDQIEDF